MAEWTINCRPSPSLLVGIPKRIVNKCTVEEALYDHAWVLDIRGIMTVEVTVEFLNLWDLLYDFQLQPKVEDTHIWRLSSSGQYSTKLAYEGFFIGSTLFGPCERI